MEDDQQAGDDGAEASPEVRHRPEAPRSSGGSIQRGGSASPGGLALACLVGAGAGLLSGLFGVGGGIVLVPALVTVLGLDQRRAAATSLVAIVPAALVGAMSYGLRAEVSLLAAALVVLGSLAGTQVGVRLLHSLPTRALTWIFVAFIALVLVAQRMSVPVRGIPLALSPGRCVALVCLGLVAGLLAGLVGVGGGVVVVPGLEIVLGASDLLARGTSLAAMVPTAVAGTAGNLRRGGVELRVGLLAGAASAACSPVGSFLAAGMSPVTGRWLFSAFLLIAAVSVLYRARRRRQPRTPPKP